MEFESQMTSETAATAEILEKYFEAEVVDVERGDEKKARVLVVPAGKHIIELKPLLDKYLPRPERRKGVATLTTLGGFIGHVNRHKDEHSVVFADTENRSAPKLVAVIDYNEAGANAGARWGEHRTVYHFPLSDEWQAWISKNNNPMPQAGFAEFLEDRIVDVLDPTGAGKVAKAFAEQIGIQLASPQRLMELSRGLSIRSSAKATNAVALSSGEATISFEEKHDDGAGGPVKVPGGFAIAIPVFRGGALYSIPVRLRYRLHGGAILWSFVLSRTDRIFEDAVDEACAKVAEETKLPLFRGRPEQ